MCNGKPSAAGCDTWPTENGSPQVHVPRSASRTLKSVLMELGVLRSLVVKYSTSLVAGLFLQRCPAVLSGFLLWLDARSCLLRVARTFVPCRGRHLRVSAKRTADQYVDDPMPQVLVKRRRAGAALLSEKQMSARTKAWAIVSICHCTKFVAIPVPAHRAHTVRLWPGARRLPTQGVSELCERCPTRSRPISCACFNSTAVVVFQVWACFPSNYFSLKKRPRGLPSSSMSIPQPQRSHQRKLFFRGLFCGTLLEDHGALGDVEDLPDAFPK